MPQVYAVMMTASNKKIGWTSVLCANRLSPNRSIDRGPSFPAIWHRLKRRQAGHRVATEVQRDHSAGRSIMSGRAWPLASDCALLPRCHPILQLVPRESPV